MPDLERRSILDFDPSARLELRASDNGPGTVVGPLVLYDDVATLPFGQERFARGVFGDLASLDLFANRMHIREQTLANTGAGLRIYEDEKGVYGEVDLLDDMYGEMTAKQVASGRLRGKSVEFRMFKDDYIDGVRVVQEARLYGWGIVDKPAYPRSVAAMRSWTEYRAEYGLETRQTTAAERFGDNQRPCRRRQDTAGPGSYCGVAGRRAGTNRRRLPKPVRGPAAGVAW